jgi:pimeloyl-ACP methyl ester carboxylesterase
VVVGVSIGAVVAAQMAKAGAILALDPAISPAGMRPLTQALPQLFERISSDQKRWVEAIFAPEADYRAAFMACRTLGVALVGERPWVEGRMRSLVSLDDVELLRTHPTIRVQQVAGAGHNLPRDAPHVVIEAIKAAVASLR